MRGRDSEDAEDGGFGESSRYAAHLDRGWALLDRGDLSAAKTSVQHAADVRPEDPDAALLQGAIALAEGDPHGGLRCYDRAIELDPEYLEPYAAAAALCLYDLDDPVRALGYLQEALDLGGAGPFERLELGLLAAECELAGDDADGARERLANCDELQVLEAALSLVAARRAGKKPKLAPDGGDEALEFLVRDVDGEPLEEDEQSERGDRVLGSALRLVQLWLDVGLPEPALGLSRRLVQWFPDDADSWNLHCEAALRGGLAGEAVAAGLRGLELDALLPLPDWLPGQAALQTAVLNILRHCAEPRIRGLLDQTTGPAILVREQPPPELVLEGVSPRIPLLATTARLGDGGNEVPVVTGIAVYRRNLARFARNAQGFEDELRLCLLEELATLLDLPTRARLTLGLGPAPEGLGPLEGRVGLAEPAVPMSPPDEAPALADKPKRRRASTRRKAKN